MSHAADEPESDRYASRPESVGQPSSCDSQADGGSGGSKPFDGARFRILQWHDKGGLGQVWVAEDQELRRKVALKEIQERWADNEFSRNRFILEAEVTGQLEHPGIVPVYGLGKYPDGRPFYAMRFIEGASLLAELEKHHQTDWSKQEFGEQPLALRKLLRRFMDVCNAIAYAHSRSVLHRDLKPGNIMLGSYGETLVVDWGLAKTQQEPSDSAALSGAPLRLSSGGSAETGVGSAVGTPQYMSPEQASGQPQELGPATDVYSLGATLYHVLVGRPPFPQADDVLKQVQQGSFPKPRQVDSTIPAPLEAICLKAMALEPGKRYQSPKAIADDIEKWLADEPVSSYSEPLSARVSRIGRRHKGAVRVAALALVVIAIGSAIFAAVWNVERTNALEARDLARQEERKALASEEKAVAALGEAEQQRDRAQRSLQRERQQLETLMSVFRELPREHMTAGSLARIFDAAEQMEQAVEKYRQEIAAGDAADDPLLQRDYAMSIKGLAELKLVLGDYSVSIEELETAQRILESLRQSMPDDEEIETSLTTINMQLTDAYMRSGRLDQARALAERQRTRSTQLADDDDPQLMSRELAAWDIAGALNNQGLVEIANGNHIGAVSIFQEALKIRNEIDAALVEIPFLRAKNDLETASLHGNFAVAFRADGKLDEAMESLNSAMALVDRIPDEYRQQEDLREQFVMIRGMTYDNMAMIHAQRDRHDECLLAARRALADLDTLDSKVEQIQIMRARCHHKIAMVLVFREDRAAALASLEEGAAIHRQLKAEQSQSIELLSDVAGVHDLRAMLAMQTGEYSKAVELLALSDAILDRIGDDASMALNLKKQRATNAFVRPFLLASLGQYADALALCDELEHQENRNFTHLMRFLRWECEAATGDYSIAVIKTEKARADRELPASTAYARILALGAKRAAEDTDPELTPLMRKQRSERYATAAIKWLNVLADDDKLKFNELAELQHAVCFDFLRNRKDFQDLLGKVTEQNNAE